MSSITTKKFIRKALYVDAVRVTAKNFQDVTDWCQGEIRTDQDVGHKFYIKVRVAHPRNIRQTRAFVGDWILYTEMGYRVYTNKAFHESFHEADQDKVVKRDYPYADGDFVVIGPECFSAQDGSVLCWQGVNYIPQGEPNSITLMGGEVVKVGPDIEEADAESKRQQVDQAA